MQCMRSALGMELASLPTTVEQDKAELRASTHPPGSRRRLALQFRLEKKMLLQAVMRDLEPHADAESSIPRDRFLQCPVIDLLHSYRPIPTLVSPIRATGGPNTSAW